MKNVVVEVDTREQNPLLFPKTLVWSPAPFDRSRELIGVEPVKKELDAGDYRLPYAPVSCVVERKAGLDELAQNLLTKDRGRFGNAWVRFIQSCRHPVLLIEDSPANIKMKGDYDKITAEDVQGALHRLIAGVPHLVVYWAGKATTPQGRMAVGAHMIRLMMSFALMDKERGLDLEEL